MKLLEKSNLIIKKYIRIKKGENKNIVFPKKGFKKF